MFEFSLNGIKFGRSKILKKEVKMNIDEFIESIFRIINGVNSDGEYGLSVEDNELRKCLIEKYIFESKTFNKCQNCKENKADDVCGKKLKTDCLKHDIFNNDNSFKNATKSKYLNYLFHIVYKKYLVAEFKDNPLFKRLLDVEYLFNRDNNSIFYPQFRLYSPINFDDIRHLVSCKEKELENLKIDLYQLNTEYIINKLNKKYSPVPYEAYCCYECFERDYVIRLFNDNFSELDEFIVSQINQIKEARTIKKPLKIYEYNKKRVKIIKQHNRRMNKGRTNKRMRYLIKSRIKNRRNVNV